MADVFGVPFATSCEALANFGGVDRRFTVRGEAQGVLVVDDYGHHPTEIAATIAAAKLFGRRLVVAFQPHRYTRTRDVWDEFIPAFNDADVLIVSEIYAAGEDKIPGVENGMLTLSGTGKELMDNPEIKSAYFGI